MKIVSKDSAKFKELVREWENKGFSTELSEALARGAFPRNERDEVLAQQVRGFRPLYQIRVKRYFIWEPGTANIVKRLTPKVSQVATPEPAPITPRKNRTYRRYVWRKPIVELAYGAAA